MGASSGSDETNEPRQIKGFDPLCQWTWGQGEIQAFDYRVCVLSRGHVGRTHGRNQSVLERALSLESNA